MVLDDILATFQVSGSHIHRGSWDVFCNTFFEGLHVLGVNNPAIQGKGLAWVQGVKRRVFFVFVFFHLACRVLPCVSHKLYPATLWHVASITILNCADYRTFWSPRSSIREREREVLNYVIHWLVLPLPSPSKTNLYITTAECSYRISNKIQNI